MYRASTYRVLIGSPGDMSEERQAAAETVHDWNTQHSAAEQAVLLPVMWETHARADANAARPQAAINDQLVKHCDILVGMFWTRLGTPTGVAASGTVEEIEQFVAAGKDAMLYFSHRPVDPNAINLAQQRKLHAFKGATQKKALLGSFASVAELRQFLLRDLTRLVRDMQLRNPPRRGNHYEQALQVTEIIRLHRKHRIKPEDYQRYATELLMPHKGGKPATAPAEVGPNNHRVEYLKNGDKVEWIPDDDTPGEEWPLILRRGDKAISEAYEEHQRKVWYNRHMNLRYRIEQGLEKLTPGQMKFYESAKVTARKVERKYGKKSLRWDDFEWGLLSGRMSALSWVMGSDWESSLDT